MLPLTIIEMGSPETRLNDWIADEAAEAARLDLLASYGVNQIYWSVLNTDGNPDITLDASIAPRARKYAEAIAARGMRSHILASERETWTRLRDTTFRQQHFRWIAQITDGLDAIVCLGEEMPPGAHVGAWAVELRAALDAAGSTATPISIHNWPGEQPWMWDGAVVAAIDLIAYQVSSASEFGRIATLPLPAYNCEWGGSNWARGIPGDDETMHGLTGLEWARLYWQVGAAAMRNSGRRHLGCGLYSGYVQDGCTDIACPMPQKHEKALRLWATLTQDINADGVIDAADLIGEH